MSLVDNVILSFSILEDSVEHEDGPDTWRVMDQINAWTREKVGMRGQVFGPDIGGLPDVYGGSKFLETPVFIAAFNYFQEDDFIAFLRTLPWREPGNVQLIIKRQDDELFEVIRPCASDDPRPADEGGKQGP